METPVVLGTLNFHTVCVGRRRNLIFEVQNPFDFDVELESVVLHAEREAREAQTPNLLPLKTERIAHNFALEIPKQLQTFSESYRSFSAGPTNSFSVELAPLLPHLLKAQSSAKFVVSFQPKNEGTVSSLVEVKMRDMDSQFVELLGVGTYEKMKGRYSRPQKERRPKRLQSERKVSAVKRSDGKEKHGRRKEDVGIKWDETLEDGRSRLMDVITFRNQKLFDPRSENRESSKYSDQYETPSLLDDEVSDHEEDVESVTSTAKTEMTSVTELLDSLLADWRTENETREYGHAYLPHRRKEKISLVKNEPRSRRKKKEKGKTWGLDSLLKNDTSKKRRNGPVLPLERRYVRKHDELSGQVGNAPSSVSWPSLDSFVASVGEKKKKNRPESIQTSDVDYLSTKIVKAIEEKLMHSPLVKSALLSSVGASSSKPNADSKITGAEYTEKLEELRTRAREVDSALKELVSAETQKSKRSSKEDDESSKRSNFSSVASMIDDAAYRAEALERYLDDDV